MDHDSYIDYHFKRNSDIDPEESLSWEVVGDMYPQHFLSDAFISDKSVGYRCL